ncbi:MAG: hypothetical protein D6819_07720 [Gammaproteobacteria bacterium]|nr:MAG: hypothetical protein D6819_07720 [Gammaproteobacteria bacterium]
MRCLKFLLIFAFAMPAWGGLEQSLRERAEAYWKAVEANDLVTQYKMEATAKEGKLTPEAFRARAEGRFRYENVKVVDVKVEGDKGVVTVRADERIPKWGVVRKNRIIKDPWIRIDGVWYHRIPSMESALQGLLGKKK